MLRPSALVVLVAAVFTGLLLLGEHASLPELSVLKQQHQRLAQGGYDLETLESPRLTGLPLRAFSTLLRTPVVGRIMAKVLYAENRFIEIRRLASFIPDQPLYYPFVDPPRDAVTESTLDLDAFAKQSADAKTAATAFKHWSIADYTSRYASQELSPVQVAKAVLAAIDESEKGEYPLRIFIEKHDDEILAQARASAKRWAEGKPLGVLDGVPVAVKDEVEIKGHRMTVGTSFLASEFGIAEEDSLPVARLRAAGAIILGTTNMHEIGTSVTGYNMHHGTTRNPYDPKCYTGGSSSGSATAVASGIVPLAVGLDGGGSIRIPAALCGVVGIKPTFQRAPPLAPDCPSLAHIGPIAGSVRDAAVGYAVLSGGDASFPRSYAQPAIQLEAFDETASLKGLKVGFFGAYTNHSSPEVSAAVRGALAKLEALGAELVETKLDHLLPIQMAQTLTITGEMAQNLDKYYSRWSEMSPEVQGILTFARHYSALDFLAAQRVRAFALRQLQEKVFSRVDVFVSPSTAVTAPEIKPDVHAAGELDMRQVGDIFRFSSYGNLVGNPGTAVPIGFDARGLPISLQVQSAHWNEDVMLRVAHAAERLYSSAQRQPKVYFSILDDAKQQSRE
ncbi:hypothetical protein P43SY_002979 [Pythium insidiosum]|uniref:Amidase domain-containing protein n=1 Tax=Pythium insidiosum TaxID=114742 RepID=A0AAD5LXR6_PYTIN|nr:hypothetical protein P43SY_002979 [Pythium insidiosum]